MILYFDNLITDIPLFPGVYSELDKIRESDSNYKFQDRMAVTKYALTSYAEIEWSDVIIKYQIDPENKGKKEEFEGFVRRLFPESIIIQGRSDNINKFRETAKILNALKDDWVFYLANNDHSFVAPNTNLLMKCLKKAEELSKEHKHVSIIYSHFPESLHIAREGTTLHDIGFPKSSIIEENEDYVVAKFPQGYFTSIQIVNKDLFNYWINTDIPESVVIRRLEDVFKFIPKNKRESQIVVCPKGEICSHFDGYGQTKGTAYFLPSNLIPPLFIPPGFFEKKIKISYGYKDYRKGWVNINPLKQKYSFENPNGTDLMMLPKNLPLFWGKRIDKIDINPSLSNKEAQEVLDQRGEMIRNPYLTKNNSNFIYYNSLVFFHKFRYFLRRIWGLLK